MIIVKSDVNATMRGEMLEEPVVEDDGNLMSYVSNAVMSACYMAMYAEATYGPVAANLIVEGLKGDIVKNVLEKMRMEKCECESEE